jgi:hypothetical protein
MPDDTRSRVVRHVETAYSAPLSRIDDFVSRLHVSYSHRRFVVARMGATGSTWLAKLLNSHPDVFCSHERIIAQVFPAGEFGAPDLEKLIELLAADGMQLIRPAAPPRRRRCLRPPTNLPHCSHSVSLERATQIETRS